ncbi:hypothetical protein [Sandaracinus amylolyticus]|uniref:hypothetical protein n=1 Tax=Sandaracinus amylolyticus TaxID=927083 RepID=UPI001F30CBC0|nr:hypothetical protein [Sandaracinus amylolyticus]UJR84305.1 Hypothetical protein I5071_63830 [Sandaracinus amylolyticus]
MPGRARYLSKMRARLFALLASMTILGVAATALAEPVVVVHVRRSGNEVADAEVVLRDADGVIGSCRTTAGTCEIHGVRPGRATVSARDDQGNETPGRPVMIPPDGKVSLFVAVP